MIIMQSLFNIEVCLLRNSKESTQEENWQKFVSGSSDWLNILDLITESKFEEALQHPALIGILSSGEGDQNLQASLEQNVESILSGCEGDQLNIRQLCILGVAVSCLQLYSQSNWVGPAAGLSPWTLIPPSSDVKITEEYILNELAADGEAVYNLSNHLGYLYLAKTLLHFCRQHFPDLQTTDWWLLRCTQCHQALLEERSPVLKALTMELIENISHREVLIADDSFRDLAVQFNVEAGHVCYFYYEASKAKQHFNTALKLSGLTMELTGELGKRTRFQQTDVTQLVLKVEQVGPQPWAPPADCLPQSLPKDLSLDDDTVLNTLQLTDPEKTLVATMSAAQQALALGLCYKHRKSSEGQGQIVQEECLAFVTCVLTQPQNWCVLSTALLMRSQWEWESSRRVQRSMSQLEELVNQFHRAEPPGVQRLPLLYTTQLPPHWNVQRQLAGLFEKVGATTAALEVYLRLQMWEEAIKCYTQLGKKQKAEDLIREQLAIRETPSLLCYMGDVLREEQWYEKAWQVSNGRFARAQRSLAYLHLFRKQFEESMVCFEKCLAINALQIPVWFSYGCAALSSSHFDKAAKAFRRCVNLNDENHEAWNNLATAYIRSNQKPRAFVTLQEALKSDFENWRIWENYLLVATDIGEFQELIRAYHRMLDIRHKHTDIQVLEILIKAVTSDLKDASNKPAGRLRTKALELFGRITSKTSTDAALWRLYAQLLVGAQEDVSQADKERALEYLQKAHRCSTQTVHWERDLAKCKDVLEQTTELIKTYKDCSEHAEATHAVQLLSSAKLMVKGVLNKVKQQHTDVVSGDLHADLAEQYRALEDALEAVILPLQQKKGS